MKKYLIGFRKLNRYFPGTLVLEFIIRIMEGVFINFILILILSKQEKSMKIMVKRIDLEGWLFPTQGDKTKITTKLNF